MDRAVRVWFYTFKEFVMNSFERVHHNLPLHVWLHELKASGMKEADVTHAIYDRRRFLRTGAMTIAAAGLATFGPLEANQRAPRQLAAIANAATASSTAAIRWAETEVTPSSDRPQSRPNNSGTMKTL